MGLTKAQKARKELHDDLLAQLKERGADTAIFHQQVEDYLFLYDTLVQLKADVATRGAMVQIAQGKAGNLVLQANPAIREVAAVNQQMQRLLRDLGLSLRYPSRAGGVDPDDAPPEEDDEII